MACGLPGLGDPKTNLWGTIGGLRARGTESGPCRSIVADLGFQGDLHGFFSRGLGFWAPKGCSQQPFTSRGQENKKQGTLSVVLVLVLVLATSTSTSTTTGSSTSTSTSTSTSSSTSTTKGYAKL